MINPSAGKDALQQRINTGANWFYWIAGLTLVNSVAAYSGNQFRFIIGLGTTQVLDALASSSRLSAVALGIDALVILTCAIVGRYARVSRQVYIAGMLAYGLDAILFVVFRDVFGLGFHAFALWNLSKGLRAFGELRNPERPTAAERTVAVRAA